MGQIPAIEGTCDERFARVREAFADNFAMHDELGAGVAVVLDGQTVVDLWGGHADIGRTRPWRHDTLVHVYSTTKGIVALAAHLLADRGLLDLDAPVARYWPEFAAAGKGAVPVHHLLSHRVGLPAVRTQLPPGALLDWPVMTAALAAETPWWAPGTRFGYHIITYGFLVGEVIRRVSGRS
ncbi:MAG TPA: serine hydrolase domain-containing protein, partial [Candidatus Binatus sp.]|nr:serine hydrolase domain-containing protein [Candidatus Binatus sp.]